MIQAIRQLEAQVTKCQVCGASAHREILDYHIEDLLGVRVGIVGCVEMVSCKQCGEEVITIPDTNGLIAAAAVARTMIPTRLNGAEMRFLRKAIALPAKDLAEMLQMRPETVSRWENGKEPIGVAQEKILRVLVGKALKGEQDKAPAIHFDDRAILKSALKPGLQAVDGKPLMVFHRTEVKDEEQVWDKAA